MRRDVRQINCCAYVARTPRFAFEKSSLIALPDLWLTGRIRPAPPIRSLANGTLKAEKATNEGESKGECLIDTYYWGTIYGILVIVIKIIHLIHLPDCVSTCAKNIRQQTKHK